MDFGGSVDEVLKQFHDLSYNLLSWIDSITSVATHALLRYSILEASDVSDDFYELVEYWFSEKQLRYEYSRGNFKKM